jgi:UDPglucose 6-dehydrogenase
LDFTILSFQSYRQTPAVFNALEFFRHKVVNDLAAFKQQALVIVANRLTADLEDVKERVYTRDLFGKD